MVTDKLPFIMVNFAKCNLEVTYNTEPKRKALSDWFSLKKYFKKNRIWQNNLFHQIFIPWFSENEKLKRNLVMEENIGREDFYKRN